jgi:hypothetical protein
MSNNKCLDFLLLISLASFVSISLPVSSIVIIDYKSTQTYKQGLCNGSTLTNYTVDGGFFFHATINVQATVNGTEYAGYLYYPPIKHWALGVMPREGIDDWYDSLNKTGQFVCYVNLQNPAHPMVNEWINIIGYYILLTLSMLIIISLLSVTCINVTTQQRRHRLYMTIPDELPPPYTVTQFKSQQSLYKSLNDELTTISL